MIERVAGGPVEGLLLDMDGVLTVSWKPIDGAVETLSLLRQQSVPVRVMTNTTSHSRAALSDQLHGAGFDVAPEEILTAPVATASYLRAHHPGARVYLLGETGVALQVLSGRDESRLTFLAVRRWYGWSAGRIINIDIGGGSLELSNGVDEEPEVALSLPLGAGRLTREWLPDDPPGRRRVGMLRDWLATEVAESAAEVLKAGNPDLAVATSKTLRSLARLTGAAPSGAGPRVKRTLTATGLRQLIAFISRMTAADRAELEGVSAERAPQIVAGALVAEASMKALDIESVDICPWALREGLILRKLDSEADGSGFVGGADKRASGETSVRDAGR